MIVDPYGRPIKSIRISITRQCNLKCFYCHREGDYSQTQIIMTPEEIAKIVEVASEFGVNKVKLTGGEPLLREDITEIIREIRKNPKIDDLSLVTNGTKLQSIAKDLKKAGLDRINIGLDTLNPKTYRKITGENKLSQVMDGIIAASEAGLYPIKINMVVLKNLNHHEIPNLIEFASKVGAILQVIELLKAPNMPEEIYKKYHYNLMEIEEWLKKNAKEIIVRNLHHRTKYMLESQAEVEIVRPMHNTDFCRHCTRIRVTADGKLKPCLMQPITIDILTKIREKADMETLKQIFIQAVEMRKPYFT